jgi:hypothetical protein
MCAAIAPQARRVSLGCRVFVAIKHLLWFGDYGGRNPLTLTRLKAV